MNNILLKNKIERLLLSTNRDGIYNLIAFLDNNGYYKASCLSHHKFIGGTALHSLEVYKYLKNKDCGIPDDSKIIIALLHDLCDICGFYELYGHGKRSIDLINLVKGFKLTDLERKLIRWHMYKSDAISKREKIEEAKVKRTEAWSALKTADVKSSIKGSNKGIHNIIFHLF